MKLSFSALMFGGIALLGAALAWRVAPPAEDAAMLMRYIGNLAAGHGWVWNPGSPPEDGATDALFVLVAAAATALTGLPPEAVVRGLNLLAHLGLLAILWDYWRRVLGFRPILSALLLIPLLAGPATCYIPAGFATPFFAFWVAVFFSVSASHAAGSAASGLLAVLARPEGLFLVGPELIRRWWFYPRKRAMLVAVVAIALLPGIAWLVWRQHYFGHIFPTPFYRKGGDWSLFNGLRSVYLGGMHLLPYAPVLAVGWWQASRQQRWQALLPAGVFLAMFSLLSNEMNYAARFQYAVMPVLLLSPLMLPARRWAERLFAFGGNHLAVIAGMLVALAGFSFVWLRYDADRALLQPDVRDCVGQALAPWQNRGYRLATTEAGLLPFHSNWHTLDVWGLNDHAIACAGVVSQTRLQHFGPTVVMLDEHLISERQAEWQAMNDTLRTFVQRNGYQLAARYLPPGDSLGHWYWVDSRCPDAQAIAAAIAGCVKSF